MSLSMLFTPARLGDLDLPNRIVMAPMTRLRAPDGIPSVPMRAYFADRAAAGLLLTDCSMVSDTSAAYIGAPGLYADHFIAPWRAVTDAVHAAGGRIYMQLWHGGRVGHVSLMPGGQAPLAPSAITGEGELHTPTGKQHVSQPRAMTIPEIEGITKAFGKAAKRAQAAGFDGVELHGAYGYLIDQFLQDGSNQRTDVYGGSFENRVRFLVGLIDAVQQTFGRNVGVKLSPVSRAHGMSDSDPRGLFAYVLDRLNAANLAYVHTMEALPPDLERNPSIANVREFARRYYRGTLIANAGFSPETGADAIADGSADLVSFGQLFIANPDLVERIAHGRALAQPDFSTVYGVPGRPLEQGYTDYPRAGTGG